MKQITMKTLPALLLVTFSGASLASGFALQNQNGSGNGNAFAGAAAAAEDAGTIFFNPAGMTNLPEGQNVSVAVTSIKRSIEFTDSGTSWQAGLPGALAPLSGTPVSGTNGGDAGGTALIPAAYWSMSVSPAFRIGLGISPTFGNTTEYDQTFKGRYSGYYAEMKQINFNPSIAIKASDDFSLGFGVNYAKNETEFRQKVFVGADSDVRLKGDDTAIGFNFGFMWQPTKATRVGFSHRSELAFALQGTQTASVASNPALPASVAVTAGLTTPAMDSLALSHKFGDSLELLADYTRTYWSVINKITVTRADGIPHSGLTYNFKDTSRVGLGMNYALNNTIKLRAGVALDKAPVQSAADTTMTLPDSDRTWLSLGARYSFTPSSSVDIGYTHIMFKESAAARPVYSGLLQTQTVRGTFDTSADILSLQFNQQF